MRSAAEMALTDEDIVSGVRSGKPGAAHDLYAKLRPVIERTVRRVFPGAEDHDDLVQSALERVVRTLLEGQFAGACSLQTWASTIAAHIGIDALRSRTRERLLFCRELASTPDALSAVEAMPLVRRLEARSELSRLANHLEGMKPEQSVTLLLHDVLGHELSEIADATGVTPAAAQSRLVRGRRELLKQRAARCSMESDPGEWGRDP